MIKIKSFLKTLLLTAIIAYLAAGTMLTLFQNQFIFPARGPDNHSLAAEGFQRLVLPTSGQAELKVLFHPPEAGEPVIILFHGNGDTAGRSVPRGQVLAQHGFGVMLAEYRTYGGSSGTMSEAGIYDDADAAFAYVDAWTNSPVYLYAHSIGSGVAVDLASRLANDPAHAEKIAGMVLEAPFNSLEDLIAQKFPVFPVRLLLRSKFHSDQKIGTINAPILIIHGARDDLIPIEHGEELLAAAPPGTRFERLEQAGHNNLAIHGSLEMTLDFFKSIKSSGS